MPSTYFIKIVAVAVSMLIGTGIRAQDAVSGIWYNEKKTAKIKIYKATDGLYYGKIDWLKIPNRNGKPKVDFHNPDKSKRNNPILGLTILKGFKKADEDLLDDGTVYDPENGKTYSCKITVVDDNLEVRGYVGISLFGRTTTWTKAE